MKGRIKNFLFDLSSWIKNTPERAIEAAYNAAITIKNIEDNYFESNAISKDWGYAENTYSIFQTQLQNALTTIDIRLVEYKISSKIPNLLKSEVTFIPIKSESIKLIGNSNTQNNNPSILDKLAFIDFILAKYRFTASMTVNSDNYVVKPSSKINAITDTKATKKHPKTSFLGTETIKQVDPEHGIFTPRYVEQTFVPISILQSLERIRRNITAGDSYEQDLVQEVRQTRRRINIGIRFIVILVIVTITTQQLSKNLIYNPLITTWQKNHNFEFSDRYQELAVNKFKAEKEKLEFQSLLNPPNNLEPESKIQNAEEIEKVLQQKAEEIYIFYQAMSIEGVQNLFADLTAGLVVYAILITGRKEIGIIKQFLDETLHNLNDNAKAFLIIVTTDTFVGYHSKEGWEVLIDTVSMHFGLPENRDLTLTFIAIVPVFLDALLKFWVFQALTQSSPSTSAIYGEMNK